MSGPGSIHPTAIVHPAARLGSGVTIGAYSLVGEHVKIGDNTSIGPHVVIEGHTRIGRDNRIFQFCSIGAMPQDKKYSGEPTQLEIGDRNTIDFPEQVSLDVRYIESQGICKDFWLLAKTVPAILFGKGM